MLVRTKVASNIMFEHEGDPPWFATGERILKISDGTFLYTHKVDPAGTTVTKNWADAGSQLAVGGPRLIAVLRALSKWYRAPDARMGDDPVYVFKGLEADGVTKVEYWIDKQTGFLRKISKENPKTGRTYGIKVIDIRINPEFSEDHFSFTPPEGVEINDLTQPGATPPTPLQPRP